jgi:hypothetical protein
LAFFPVTEPVGLELSGNSIPDNSQIHLAKHQVITYGVNSQQNINSPNQSAPAPPVNATTTILFSLLAIGVFSILLVWVRMRLIKWRQP